MWQGACHLYGVKCSSVFGEMSETSLSLRKCQRWLQALRKVQNPQFCTQVCGSKIFLVLLSFGLFHVVWGCCHMGKHSLLLWSSSMLWVRAGTHGTSGAAWWPCRQRAKLTQVVSHFLTFADTWSGQSLWVSWGSSDFLGCINTFPWLKPQGTRRVALTWTGFDHYLHQDPLKYMFKNI